MSEMNTNEAMAASGLAGLLAANLDDVADLPSFEVPPAGYYKLALDIEVKKINDKDAVEFNYRVLEVLELADASKTPPEVGTKFNEAFQITNEIGLGKFKAAAKPVMEALGTTQFADILGNQVRGMEVFATLKRRVHKDDKALAETDQRVYPMISNITPA
jgi:hypothetical protein